MTVTSVKIFSRMGHALFEYCFIFQTVTNSSRLPYEVVETFAKAILDGNANYARLYNEGKLTNVNLNIPEAMEALKKLLKNLEEWVTLFIVHLLITGHFESF